MYKITRCLIAAGTIILLCNSAFAEAIPPEIGSVSTHTSENGLYSVDVKILGYPDTSPAECSFKKEEKVIWTQKIFPTPGIVEISNNGQAIIFVTYGWYDEAGFKSLLFYNHDGTLIKELPLSATQLVGPRAGREIPMKWISRCTISNNGEYFALASNLIDDNVEILLYDAKKGNLLWKNEYKLDDMLIDLKISETSKYILISARDSEHYKYLDKHEVWNMQFSLIGLNGKTLWRYGIEDNYIYDISDYTKFKGIDNFEIFNRAKGEYVDFYIKEGKVVSK